jgi:hypothetical protein
VRVACSFATLGADGDHTCVYAFGLPYITHRISINSEQDLINVRLLRIRPPDALRPYFQEGYPAGTDEVTTDYESKGKLDFTRRLISKFQVPRNDAFWDGGFAPIPRSTLCSADDRLLALCDGIRSQIGTEVKAGQPDRQDGPVLARKATGGTACCPRIWTSLPVRGILPVKVAL